MNRKSVIVILLGLIFGIPVFIGTAYSQNIKLTVELPDKSVGLLKVIKPEGWEVPGIDKNATYRNETLYFQDIPVTARTKRLEKTYDTEMDFYTLNVEETLVIKSRTLEVKFVHFYSVGGKIFACGIAGSPIGSTQDGKYRVGIGILYSVFYFDEDGDGKFETRYSALEVPEHIPDWVRQLSTGDPKKYENETYENDEKRAARAGARYLKHRGGAHLNFGQVSLKTKQAKGF